MGVPFALLVGFNAVVETLIDHGFPPQNVVQCIQAGASNADKNHNFQAMVST